MRLGVREANRQRESRAQRRRLELGSEKEKEINLQVLWRLQIRLFE